MRALGIFAAIGFFFASPTTHATLLTPIENLPSDTLSGLITPNHRPNLEGWSAVGLTLASVWVSHESADEGLPPGYKILNADGVSRWLSTLGPALSLALPLGFYGMGNFQADPYQHARTIDLGHQLTESLLLTGLTSVALKYAVGRERPDGSDHQSFPSLHSAMAFSSAATLSLNAPWYVGVPALLAASAIGFSRVDLQKHYLSDVVAGAGIGAFYSYSVWRHHRAQRFREITPWVSPEAIGVSFGI